MDESRGESRVLGTWEAGEASGPNSTRVLCPPSLSLWSFNTALCIFSFLVAQMVKICLPFRRSGSIPGWEDPLKKEQITYSSVVLREYHRRRSLVCYRPVRAATLSTSCIFSGAKEERQIYFLFLAFFFF